MKEVTSPLLQLICSLLRERRAYKIKEMLVNIAAQSIAAYDVHPDVHSGINPNSGPDNHSDHRSDHEVFKDHHADMNVMGGTDESHH